MYNSQSFQKKSYRYILGLIGGCFIGIFLCVSSVHASDDTNLNKIKEQILNDPEFISSLSQKVQKETSDEHIRQIVRNYLISNPEVMLEVQDAFEEKQQKELAQSQTAIIDRFSDRIFHSPYDAVIGNPEGKITLVEFFDYNCGYCKKSYPDIEKLISKNPELRVVIKDFPILGPDSVKAHIVAQAFKNLMPEKYSEFHKTLLTSNGRANETKALQIAKNLGADETKLKAAIANPLLQQAFTNNAEIAYDLKINGTPSYIIGSQVIVGAVNGDVLDRRVKELDHK
ncbi:DsbA family protein [Bartonella tamiae]|uniref:Thioredoxin domain-containing protein n=1 Tax=Bartonella tamiae Th239 TaxID=1094558 RepID=J0QS90_9HYPH|nr:DsbA family protein [Bartonella tamiae]EJF88736.1 hypothetical protein ME5_01287 [Bartonella tamiae Th239]EJF95014.1 hypothetical protein MEG_00595 [Bartonella tamiae Th307]